MLTQEGCLARQKRLWETVPDHLEWILIADPRHVLYLSNFLVQPCSFSRGERALLLLDREKGVTLVGDNFTLRSSAAEFYVDHEAIETWYDHKHSVENRDHALFKALKSVVPQLKGRPGAIEAEWLPVGALQELEITQTDATLELGSVLRQLRRQKHADEIALLKQCMQACDAGHACAREVVAAGKSEFDIFRKVQAAVLQAAGLPVIIYGDFRASTPAVPKAGGLPSGHVLENGDLFVLDYSVVIHGYRSDFTNTIAVGEPSAEQEKLF
ncbi:MAG TPA: aminopeptidase P family protein, partial [Planctomycetaceae bacterium]|nr:aminopeptidase P family protein [Planctomycetaceae bacterium]